MTGKRRGKRRKGKILEKRVSELTEFAPEGWGIGNERKYHLHKHSSGKEGTKWGGEGSSGRRRSLSRRSFQEDT